MAVNEPALSFEFDSSQSLFEQLTKAQQANSSSFSAQASTSYSQSTSPVLRAMDSMPPPQMVPQTMQSVPEDMNHTTMYGQMTMPTPMPSTMASNLMKREQDYGQLHYDRNGIPLSRVHQRHTSMPTYMEYSPAPSFVSSHYEDYSNRGISFEPITPPQHAIPLGAEPAYIANEDTGLYTAIPDVGSSQHFGGMMQLPPSNLAGTQFSTATRSYPTSNVYSVIEGSPTYKQRRRRSSIPAGIAAAVATSVAHATTNGVAHAAHRPSDLRRSMSSSVVPVAEGDESSNNSPPGLTNSYSSLIAHQLDLSRNGTPLPTLEGSPAQNPISQAQTHDGLNHLSNLTNGDYSEHSMPNNAASRFDRPGPVRRARSATMMELGPYPHRSHSCPIPTCGRVFKRLEHLKRYVSSLSSDLVIFHGPNFSA